MSERISVKERLPEPHKEVIVSVLRKKSPGKVLTGWKHKDPLQTIPPEEGWKVKGFSEKVTHWMPLPEPPK